MQPGGASDTRARILAAAETFFADAGYHGTRLQDIAHRVGVQKPSLFHYFASKDELYRAVLDRGFGESEQMIRRVLEQPRPPLATVCALVDACVEMVASHPARTKLLLRQSIGDAPVRRTPADSERLLRPVIEFIAAGQRSRAFAAVDPLAFVLGVIGALVFFFTSASVLADGWNARQPEDVARIKQHVELLVTRMLSADVSTRFACDGGAVSAVQPVLVAAAASPMAVTNSGDGRCGGGRS